ncbi:hypothetical protein RhiTH_006853 [Rhizoctonia solani]
MPGPPIPMKRGLLLPEMLGLQSLPWTQELLTPVKRTLFIILIQGLHVLVIPNQHIPMKHCQIIWKMRALRISLMPIPFIQQTLSPFTPPIGRSARSKSRTRIEPEPQPQQYLNVQAPVQHRRCSSATGSHRSRAAPSLTHSAPSTSDDDNESDAGRSVGGINTPFTAKVALWRDDVRDMCDEMPPETILPPHIKAQYEYSRRQYEASPSSKPVDIPRIVVPSYTAPSRASSRAPSQAPSRASSRASSPRSASPPTSLPSLPSAPVSDLEKIIENIEDIEYQINARVLEFTFPSILDFGERFPNGEFPPLPYTVRNKSLIEHRDYLEKSLLSMDEIQSFGDSRVKCTRKRVVTKIEEQLEQLNRMEKMVRDNMHYERWKKTPRIQVTAPPGST